MSKSKIQTLVWQYIEDFDFYRIDYTLDGYWHRIQLTGWNVDTDIPTFMCKALRAKLDCVPEERIYR